MTLTAPEQKALTRLGCPPEVLDYYNERRHEMTERTDHAKAAATILQNIAPAEMGNPETSDWLAAAQVHATLALVKQQRVQNVLKVEEISLRAQGWHPPLDIAAALGIEEVQS